MRNSYLIVVFLRKMKSNASCIEVPVILIFVFHWILNLHCLSFDSSHLSIMYVWMYICAL